jgi:hypothetical protein
MGAELIRQTMFSSGEVDAINYQRSDFKDYLTAAQSLLNVEVGTTGLAKKRKGTQFLLQTSKSDPNSKLYGFQDKNGQFYCLISGHLCFDVYTIQQEAASELQFLQTLSTPYPSEVLNDLDYSNDNDSLILVHAHYPPARITIKNYAPLLFSYDVLNLYPLPAYDFGDVIYNKGNASLSGDVHSIQLTLTDSAGFNEAWIGGQIIGGGTSDISPLGYAIITKLSYQADQVTFTGKVQIPFLIQGASTSASQYSIRKPAFSTNAGYPSKVIFFQNRLWFANTKTLSNTLFASKINAPVNFDVGVGQETDAIIYTLGQSDSGGIVWMNGGKELEIYTSNYEFVAPQEQNVGLTPATFSIRQQSAYGVSDKLKPISYLNNSYYVNKTGNAIINFCFQGIGQSYLASNISQAASHLVKNPIKAVLLRGTDQSQDNFIYFLNPDHTITAFQFAHEVHLAALTPFSTHHQIEIQDIVAIDNTIYLLKKYLNSQQMVLEKMVLDIKLDGSEEKTLPENGKIAGLDRFEGLDVQVMFNQEDYGVYPVKQGVIQVHNPEQKIGPCCIGLLYRVEIRPMYFYGGPSHADLMKKITKIYVEYVGSLNFYISDQLVNYQIFLNVQQGNGLHPSSGTAIISPVFGWSRQKTFSITQKAPFDLQITSIAYQINTTMI